MPFSCTNARAEGRTESLLDRATGPQWCSVYSGKGNKDMCISAFIMYNTSVPHYQTCKYNCGTPSTRFSCCIDPELKICESDPPASPPPPLLPLPPASPSPMPPPMPPILCPMMDADMVSIRDQATPTWCHDYNDMQAECEHAYIRASNTYVRCVYHAVAVDDGMGGHTHKCSMDVAGQASCFASPPAPPVPPSPPSTCPKAATLGLSYDLRDYPVHEHEWKMKFSEYSTEKFNSGHVEMGHTQYAVCSLYTDHSTECKHAYQSNGHIYYPCLYREVDGRGSCAPSPTARLC